MNKFLVIARPSKPLPEGKVDTEGVINHLEELREKRGAEVYTLIEDTGHGFVILIDVESHDQLMVDLIKNPMIHWGTYQVFALGTMEAEISALESIGFKFSQSQQP